nr:hypothetical protein CFP56_71533 [Quercus suber]
MFSKTPNFPRSKQAVCSNYYPSLGSVSHTIVEELIRRESNWLKINVPNFTRFGLVLPLETSGAGGARRQHP